MAELEVAMANSDVDQLRQLVANGLDLITPIELYGSNLNFYVHRFAHNDQLDPPERRVFLNAMIECGANIAFRDDVGKTALHKAAARGSFGAIHVLIANGSDVNSLDNMENTPLHDAAWHGEDNCIRALLENHADELLKNREQQIPGDIALMQEYYRSAKILMKPQIRLAFMMGKHARLGQDSVVASVEEELLKLVLQDPFDTETFPTSQLRYVGRY